MKKVWIPILIVLILALAVFIAVRCGVFRSPRETNPDISDEFVSDGTEKAADSSPAAASDSDDASAAEESAEPGTDDAVPASEAHDSTPPPDLVSGEEYVIIIDEDQAVAGF